MISVCIATHNGEKYILKQLLSILPQLSQCDEIIISDDGSVDSTIQLIKSLKDNRIKIYEYRQKDYSMKKFSSFYYASANFHNALLYSQGDFIFLADQDDIWSLNKVEVFSQYLEKYDIVSSNFSIIDENDSLILELFYPKGAFRKLNAYSVLKEMPFRGCCLAFKRTVLLNAIPFPNGLFLHDCWIGLNAYFSKYSYFFIDESLLFYRRHSSNVSDMKSPNNIFFKMKYRVRLLSQLFWLQFLKLIKYYR